MNENSFISSVGGVRNDVLNFIDSQQSFKGINNKNGDKQKSKQNLDEKTNLNSEENKVDKASFSMSSQTHTTILPICFSLFLFAMSFCNL